MSCPDWQSLVAARELASETGSATVSDDRPPGWAEARRHVASCGRCRQAALAADPLLLFTRLPETTVTPAEIGDMQSSVMALVRASRIAQVSPAASSGNARETMRAQRGGVFSASRIAAALGICSLLALSGAPRRQPPALSTAATVVPTIDSVIEELDRPGARIYELPQADMAVVMIVDASLDV